MKFFDPESKLMQFLSRVFDLGLLNCLFLLCCIPVVTVGAASAAMYTVAFAMDTEREQGLIRTFFRGFKENFVQATVFWLGFVVFFALIFIDLSIVGNSNGTTWTVITYVMITLLALGTMMYAYAFPLISQFRGSLLMMLKNSLLISLAFLPRTLIVIFMNLFPLIVMIVALPSFVQLGFIWFFLYFGISAYCNARVLNKVFDRFRPKEETA